ncbi:MAG: hypothetical protein RR766_01000 [Longicatena sp.]
MVNMYKNSVNGEPIEVIKRIYICKDGVWNPEYEHYFIGSYTQEQNAIKLNANSSVVIRVGTNIRVIANVKHNFAGSGNIAYYFNATSVTYDNLAADLDNEVLSACYRIPLYPYQLGIAPTKYDSIKLYCSGSQTAYIYDIWVEDVLV